MEERTYTSHLFLNLGANISSFHKLSESFQLGGYQILWEALLIGSNHRLQFAGDKEDGKGAGWFKSCPFRGGTPGGMGVIKGPTHFFTAPHID